MLQESNYQGSLLEAKLLDKLNISFQIYSQVNKKELNQFDSIKNNYINVIFSLPKIKIHIEEYVGYEITFEDIIYRNIDTEVSEQDDVSTTNETNYNSNNPTRHGTIADLESYHIESMELQEDIQDLARTVRALEWDLKQSVWFSQHNDKLSSSYAKFEYAAKKHQFARQALAANRIKSNRTEYLLKIADLKQSMISAVSRRSSELDDEIDMMKTMQDSLISSTKEIVNYNYNASAKLKNLLVDSLPGDLVDDIADTTDNNSNTELKSSSANTANYGKYEELLNIYDEKMSLAVESYPEINDIINRKEMIEESKASEEKLPGRGRVMSVASLFPDMSDTNLEHKSELDIINDNKQKFRSLKNSDYYASYIQALTEHCSKTLHGFHHELRDKMKECVNSATDAMFRSHGSYQYIKGKAPYGERVHQVLQRIHELEYQLESFSRHQDTMRKRMLSEHDRLVKQASAAVIERRMNFLNTLKDKLTSLHRSNIERSRWLKKQVLKENSIKFQ